MKNILFFVLLSGLLVACGGETESTTDTASTNTEEAAKPKSETRKAPKKTPKRSDAMTVEIEAGDDMRYNTALIQAKPGQEVTVNLKHVGQMTEQMMGHNFVLLAENTDVESLAMSAIEAADNEYIPESDAILAYTEMIGGGESTSVTFTAPEAGIYDFICTFPGHYGLMNGKMIVK